jgi:crotonobetainyl-CoA:carnitine CoA-transferase CaiB-like acyl-CoA transferase
LDDVRARAPVAEHLFEVLDAWAARYAVDELVEGAQLRRIPYAAVRAPEALLRDPHLAERGFFVPIEHPDLGTTVPYPGAPFRLTDAPWRFARPPWLGEHNAAVYGEVLGLGAAELAALAQEGVV